MTCGVVTASETLTPSESDLQIHEPNRADYSPDVERLLRNPYELMQKSQGYYYYYFFLLPSSLMQQ